LEELFEPPPLDGNKSNINKQLMLNFG